MKTHVVTVDELWPGDVIIVRRPGGFTGTPHKLLDVRQGGRYLECASLDGLDRYGIVAPDGYSTAVERVA